MESKIRPFLPPYSVVEMMRSAYSRGKTAVLEMLLRERNGIPVALVHLGHVTWVGQEGSESLSKLYIRNTDQRFIVTKELAGYCVYDLDTARLDKESAHVAVDDPEIFPTEEAAVMSAMLRA